MADFPRSAGGIPVVALETVGSTNVEALAHATAGESAPLWVAARRQTAGRGRRGRIWISERGNLYASLLLVDAAPLPLLPGICFVAALAVHDALLNAAHGLVPAQLRLKWPNDVLLNGRKLSGILVEGTSLDGGRTATAIGIGVNCIAHPIGMDFSATDLAACGYSTGAESLLAAIGDTMAARLREWDGGGNFAAIRTAWLARAMGIGGEIEVRLQDRSVAGTFEAIDPNGALILKRRDGTRETVAAGDVFPVMAGGRP